MKTKFAKPSAASPTSSGPVRMRRQTRRLCAHAGARKGLQNSKRRSHLRKLGRTIQKTRNVEGYALCRREIDFLYLVGSCPGFHIYVIVDRGYTEISSNWQPDVSCGRIVLK